MSLMKCMLSIASLGLEPDGYRAHLIPRRNSERNCLECTYIIDYKGYIDLLRKPGSQIKSVRADVICENDQFEHDLGVVMKHTYDIRLDRGAVIGVYAVVILDSGIKESCILSVDEVQAVRSRSKAKSGPWVTDWNEMAKKTALRRLVKYLPIVPEVVQAITDEDAQESGQTLTVDAIINESAPAELTQPKQETTEETAQTTAEEKKSEPMAEKKVDPMSAFTALLEKNSVSFDDFKSCARKNGWDQAFQVATLDQVPEAKLTEVLGRSKVLSAKIQSWKGAK